ncbi:MAG: Mut7-C ubiquitin/RNAse domain-containing protein [Candidatus Thiodiazotropha sp. (ex Rostrolucina anterorostrata)]|nr:Mut7-C ubiquitin/RNAse domain-containing protein [Candidatus Thiodiazotropha sp. (ex Rostrolucina anterorostrata)]
MPQVSPRFYEELNDFLPGSLRKRTFEKEFTGTQSVKHLIENLGVPHTEVEIILVNGQSVDLSYPLQEGDRISVYPMFELLDILPLLRLRIKPMRDPCFMADAHLGKLSRYLRLLGFDCLFFNDAGDSNLARISVEQGRVLLTRDRGLLMRRNITHGCFPALPGESSWPGIENWGSPLPTWRTHWTSNSVRPVSVVFEWV